MVNILPACAETHWVRLPVSLLTRPAWWAFLLLGVCGLVSCALRGAHREPGPDPDRVMRVLLLGVSGTESVELDTTPGLLITDDDGKRYRVPPAAGQGTMRVSGEGALLTVQGLDGSRRQVEVAPTNGEVIAVDGMTYRGTLRITADPDGLRIQNLVVLDEYLYGVVPREMPADWHPVGLEAQAIAARTYALYEAHTRGAEEDFDVYDTARSQVYGGVGAEKESARQAVDRTHGMVLLHRGELLHTYFHSTCGGHTGDASRLFGGPYQLPLAGRPCGQCSASRYHRWQHDISLAEAGARLTPLIRRAADGRKLGALRSLAPLATDEAGRAWSFLAILAEGRVELPALEARLALGPGEVRSTACSIEVEGDRLHFTGQGWGHGVGMCQLGVRSLAEAGHSSRAILSFYYPGSQLGLLPARGARP